MSRSVKLTEVFEEIIMTKNENSHLSWLGFSIMLLMKKLRSVVRFMPIGMLLIMLILMLTITNPACTHDDNHAGPDTLPRFTTHTWGPTWSPDGQTIAFGYVPWREVSNDSIIETWDSSGIYLIDSDGNNKKPLLLSGTSPFLCNPDFHPNGNWLVFIGGPESVNNVYKATVTGDSVTQLTFDGSYWDRHPKWSPDGKKILFGRANAPSDSSGLCMMDEDGLSNRVINQENAAEIGDFLPDYRITFEGWISDMYGIWLTDTTGSYKDRIFNNYTFMSIDCSPNGSEILICYYEEENHQFEIWTIKVDGTDAELLCVDGIDPCWSPDGSKIVFVKFNYWKQAITHPGYGELWLMKADGSNQHQLTYVD